MSVVWVRDNLVKYLRENREGIKDTILAGVKDMS